MARERTGHPPSNTEDKKINSLTLHTHGCPRASLKDCSSLLLLPVVLLVSLMLSLSNKSIAVLSNTIDKLFNQREEGGLMGGRG